MIKLKDLISDSYGGKSMSKMTSIVGGVVKPIEQLVSLGKFTGKVIDYGCGKIARNANYIREKRLNWHPETKVYAYDPYWGSADADPWTEISSILPKEKFDSGFSSYVLNVVTIPEENEILDWFDSYCKEKYHVVRNLDVNKMIGDAIRREDKIVTDFFLNVYGKDPDGAGEFGGNIENIDRIKTKSQGWDVVVSNFAEFGTKTSKGFQRVPFLEDEHGYNLLRSTSGYKVYYKR